VSVGDGDAETGPVEQLAVVLAVAPCDRLGGREAEPLRDEREARALVHVRVRELEEVGERLRDEQASVEARLQHVLERVERVGISDRDELRRVCAEPLAQVAHLVDLEALEACIGAGLGRHLGDVQLVVDVAS